VKKIDGQFLLHGTKIKSHILGLLLIDGCTSIVLDNKEVQTIVNKWLEEPMSKQRMINCQNELIDLGYEEFAQL
jgi:hypothetical protein